MLLNFTDIAKSPAILPGKQNIDILNMKIFKYLKQKKI